MIRLRTTAIAIAIFICMPFAASAKCGMPPDIDALVAKLRLTMFASAGTTREYTIEVGRLALAVDQKKVSYALNQLDLARSREVVDYLVKEASIIAKKGRVPDRRGLQSQIRVYDKLSNQACLKQSKDGARSDKTKGISQITISKSASMAVKLDGGVEPPDQSLFFLALLAPGVLGLLAILAGGRLAYQWISAFTFSHRSCKIAATLECGLDFVDGNIIILGKKGCRFKPVSEDEYEQLEWLDDFDDCVINVGPHRLFGRVDGLHGSFAVFFFEHKIKDELLEALMEASSVPPKYVRRSTPKSNRENFKKPELHPDLQKA